MKDKAAGETAAPATTSRGRGREGNKEAHTCSIKLYSKDFR